MKNKVNIFLILAVFCTIGVSAETIYFWHNGIKTELAAKVNDSITFDEDNTSLMRVWRDGSEIYQLTLAANDSITCAEDKPDVPEVHAFDYDHWRDQDTITIYEFHDHVWQTVALPWAEEAQTTIPSYYRFPNLESHIDTINQDTVPNWQLAFNTCHNPTLDGVHMFGLWNEKSNIMRIYSYLEELPNANAAYCFYRVVADVPAFIDRDAMTWMPSENILKAGNWNAGALSGVATAPSTTMWDLMPFASLKADGSEAFVPVFPGWIAFDMPLSSGLFSVPENSSITFSLESVEKIDASGSVDFDQELGGKGSGTGASIGKSTGGITIPGNKNKEAAGFLTAFGSFVHDIGSAITSGISAGNISTEGGVAGGVVQGVGSAVSLVGNCMNAVEEGKDKKYGLEFSTIDTTTYDLNFNFNGTIKGKFNAQLTSTLASTAKPLTISYDKFFENLLAHPHPNQAPRARKDNSDNNGSSSLSLGIWNLKHQPVYYIYDKYDPLAIHPNGMSTIVSFLDPSSIELDLNMDNPLFDANEIDTITLIAYDFAFVDNANNLSAQPYYNFYGIPNSVSISDVPACYYSISYTDFLLDQSATYKTFTKGNYSYTGVASDSLAAYGFGMYNMVYSPAIHIHATEGNQNFNLSDIGVAVIVEMAFKNGEKRVFAERYLPEIKVFTLLDLRESLGIEDAPENINGIPLKCPLHGMQKGKFNRLIDKIAL